MKQLPLDFAKRRVVVGFSGGVTSAWCAGWALRNYPRRDVVLLWHDTKEEHPDTYRFLREMADALRMPITERSDGRSVTDLFYDEGFLGNNQNAMCSRILKREQGERFVSDLMAQGFEVIKVYGFSARETERIQRAPTHAESAGYKAIFPCVEEDVSKQTCADWCNCTMGVKPSAMYEWAEHANCVGCVKGGKAYWLAVHRNHPDVFAQRSHMEDEFGHSILRGDSPVLLRDLVKRGLKRQVNPREAITIGPCECGD